MNKIWSDRAWSRRIDDENRLVYNIDSNGNLWIIACRHVKEPEDTVDIMDRE